MSNDVDTQPDTDTASQNAATSVDGTAGDLQQNTGPATTEPQAIGQDALAQDGVEQDGVEQDGVTSTKGTDATDDTDDADDDADDDEEESDDPLVREGDVAGDYLERLLDILDLDGDIDLDVEGERAVVAVVGGELRHLVGVDGQTLDALQELTRLAVTTQTGNRSRLMLDIDGYRQNRREQLTELAIAVSTQVTSTGQSQELKAMNPFERKVVHDAVAAIAGVQSESKGEEPSRRVVILPTG